MIVPGYICIKLRETTNNQIYTIDFRNSFILIPNYSSNSTSPYYNYLDYTVYRDKDAITWNDENIEYEYLTSLDIDHTICTTENFTELQIENPYQNKFNLS